MIEQDEGERLAKELIQEYPYPLAATYHRAFRQVSDPVEVHDYTLDLVELSLKYCAAITISEYFAGQRSDAKIHDSLQNLQRPSLGHWLSWLRDILDLYRRERRTLRVPEMATFCGLRNTTELPVAVSALRQIMVERMGSAVGDRKVTVITPLQFFDLIVEYRNKLAHGVHPSPFEKKRVAEILKPAVRALLREMRFLADYRLTYVRRVEAEDDPRAGTLRFAHYVTNLIGNAPWESEHPQLTESKDRAPKERLYLLDKTGNFRPLVSLHPLLIFRYCENCSREQVFLLNESVVATADYLSYPCTHHFRPTEYLDDLRSLLTTSERPNAPKLDRTTWFAADQVTEANDVAVPLEESPTPSKETALDAVEQQGGRGKVTDATVNSVDTGVGRVQARSEATPLVSKARPAPPVPSKLIGRPPASLPETATESSAPPVTIAMVPPIEDVRPTVASRKNVIVAVALSVVFAGAGHLYLGQTRKGLILMGLVGIAWLLAILGLQTLGSQSGGVSVLCLIGLVALVIYSAIDALKSIHRVNHTGGQSVIVAVGLSVIFAGAGHLYLGQTKKGLILMGLVGIAWLLIAFAMEALGSQGAGVAFLSLISLLALVIYSAIDAVKSIRRLNHTGGQSEIWQPISRV